MDKFKFIMEFTGDQFTITLTVPVDVIEDLAKKFGHEQTQVILNPLENIKIEPDKIFC